MTATVKVHAGGFFRLIQVESVTKFFDIRNRLFNEYADHIPVKSNINLPTLSKNCSNKNFKLIVNEWSQTTNNKICVVCLERKQK